MLRILHLLNKSTKQVVWVRGDRRGKFKDYKGILKLLVLDCYVDSGFPHKGIAYVNEVTVDFDNCIISGKENGSIKLESTVPELSLNQIINQNRGQVKRNSNRNHSYCHDDDWSR